MRLYEFTSFLLEYKRDITQQRMGDKLVQAAANDQKQDIGTILNTLEQIDPTKNKQYTEWLCRQYINKQFRLEDAGQVNDVLQKFEHIKNKLQQRDINKYSFYSLDDAIDKEYNIELKTGDEKQDTDIPDVKVLYNGPLGNLSIPLTKEASCILGSGTKWCTAAKKNNKFNSYNKPNDPLYVWKDKSGEKYQFSFGSTQFMDDKNHSIDHKLLTYFRTEHPVLKRLFKEGEKAIASDPGYAYSYAKDVIRGRWPEVEKAIASDPRYAYYYARDVIRGRWPEGEKAIASDPYSAYSYARDVIRGRWPEVEKAIASDPGYAYHYAANVIKGRWPEVEKAIASDPGYAYNYATNVIKGRWPEGEKAIASDPGYAKQYKQFLKSIGEKM